MDTESASLPIVVILVHGTWAPNSAWTKADHEFSRTLIKSARRDCHVEAFEWRGWLKSPFNNSHRHRLAAGADLAALIDLKRQQFPRSPVFLVGHSHGGNVAVYAARHSAPDGLVCLATPFLAKGPLFHLPLLAALSYSTLAGLSWLVATWSGLWVLGWAGFALLSVPLWLRLVGRRNRRLQEQDQLQTTEIPEGVPVLCAAYKADESHLLLNLLALPRVLALLVLNLWSVLGCLGLVTGIYAVGFGVLGVRLGDESPWHTLYSVSLGVVCAVVLLSLVLFWISSFATNLLSFGVDAAFRSTLYGLHVRRLPTARLVQEMKISTPLRETLLRFRHGAIKYDPEVQQEAGSWIGKVADEFFRSSGETSIHPGPMQGR